MYADASDTAETSIELLREFEQTGDAAIFELFMRRHAAMVYATCLKVTRDPHDAEDATQATFLTLASKSRLNGEIRQPEAWLRKVAHRLSLDLIRSKKRRVNRENARSEMNSEEAPLDSHDHADRGEMKSILNEELAKLPASYRMPLVLHYFGGLSRDEMASQLKLKPSTLGVRLHRAREQLRKRLAQRGVILPSAALSLLLAESVHFAIGERMVAATAAQASAMVMSQQAPAMFSASAAGWAPSATMIQSITDVIARSKVKLIASVVVLGSALGATNAQVQKLIPAVVREWMPSFVVPNLSLPTFRSPLPTLVSQKPVEPIVEPAPASFAMAAPVQLLRVPAITAPAASIGGAASSAHSGGTSAVVESSYASYAPVLPPVPTVTMARIGAEPARIVPEPVRPSLVPMALATAAPRPAASSSNKSVDANAPSRPAAGDRTGAAWGSIIADRSANGSAGPSAPAFGDTSTEGIPEALLAPVIGESPLASGGGGGGGGGSSTFTPATENPGNAQPAKTATAAGLPAPSVGKRSRTVIFSGTSANYGGYADDAWTASPISDLSGVVAPIETPTVAGPAAPSQVLSVNGARVTMHGVSDEAAAIVSFLDTMSADYPTLPTGHHFIGAWSIDSNESFSSADVIVRYDDLRAARLGLSEQILKLWVSDGKTWTLMWHDPSFGRDVAENLLWVTAGGGFKYFAVSAPEPGVMLVGALVLGGMSVRRRRR